MSPHLHSLSRKDSSRGLKGPEPGLLYAVGHFLLLLLAWLADETTEQVTLWLSAWRTCRIPEQGGACWEFCEG